MNYDLWKPFLAVYVMKKQNTVYSYTLYFKCQETYLQQCASVNDHKNKNLLALKRENFHVESRKNIPVSHKNIYRNGRSIWAKRIIYYDWCPSNPAHEIKRKETKLDFCSRLLADSRTKLLSTFCYGFPHGFSHGFPNDFLSESCPLTEVLTPGKAYCFL